VYGPYSSVSEPRPLTRDDVIAFIRRVRFGHLATRGLDFGASVRPVEIDTVYGNDLYFCTWDTAGKVQEIASDPHVTIVWTDMESWSQVRVQGTARVEDDATVVERFKAENPLISEMLPPGTEELFTLYRVRPDYVQVAEGIGPYTHVPW
jgi:uncharacterized pyridoxamine 5'-phosphate oxidase family protein